LCERKKWAEEARSYNGLVVAWPELLSLANKVTISGSKQQDMFS
jgi:putative DNA methylase